MMVSLAQDSGYPGMNHVDGTTLTYGHPPPAQYVQDSFPLSPILIWDQASRRCHWLPMCVAREAITLWGVVSYLGRARGSLR
jgi:hypothetical protein